MCQLRGIYRRGGLADLLREENAAAGAAGVAMPVDIIRIAVLSEPIRRVAVDVFPRARFVIGNQTKGSTLVVLVLV